MLAFLISQIKSVNFLRMNREKTGKMQKWQQINWQPKLSSQITWDSYPHTAISFSNQKKPQKTQNNNKKAALNKGFFLQGQGVTRQGGTASNGKEGDLDGTLGRNSLLRGGTRGIRTGYSENLGIPYAWKCSRLRLDEALSHVVKDGPTYARGLELDDL